MKLRYIIFLWMCIFIQCVKTLQTNPTIVNVASLMENALNDCYLHMSAVPFNQLLPSLQSCLRNGSLTVLDEMLQSEVFELSSGIQFVDNKMGNIVNSNNTSPRNFSWKREVLLKLHRLLRSHNLKIHLSPSFILKGSGNEEARRRHHNHAMPLIIFATVALGMVLIPMGFQFLAVLGGKALLLAKMALLLSSIQGLKKIASSNVSYGLYQTPDRCK